MSCRLARRGAWRAGRAPHRTTSKSRDHMTGWSVRMALPLYKPPPYVSVPHSCARARTVASEVFTEAQSFADCKLHIRTRLLASAFSNFWKTPYPSESSSS